MNLKIIKDCSGSKYAFDMDGYMKTRKMPMQDKVKVVAEYLCCKPDEVIYVDHLPMPDQQYIQARDNLRGYCTIGDLNYAANYCKYYNLTGNSLT